MLTCNIFHVSKTLILNNVKRIHSSALYITGDKAKDMFSVLTPHLDFDERLKNRKELELNIKLRELNIDLNRIEDVWKFYKNVQSKKKGLEEAKLTIAQMIKSLSSENHKEEIDKLKVHGKMVKEDMKILKDTYYSIEESAAIKVLSIPNIVHPNTPEIDPSVIYTFQEKPQSSSNFHLDIAEDLDLIEYSNPNSYFLKNDAALFELSSTFYITEELLNKNYIQFSNSDFVRSVIVEGCGVEYYNPEKVFTISETDFEHKHETSRMHLVGGSTLYSFMAYHAKHTIFPTLLPLKYFTIGRKYKPVSSKANSLLNVSQETSAEVFVATKDNLEDMNNEFDKVIEDIMSIYQSLGCHFRVCYLPVKELEIWESLRASIQMYSPFSGAYVEVGYVNICDDYVSKRLQFNYGTGYNISYPKVISGTIFSVPKVLACIIENNYIGTRKTILNDNLKKYIS